MMQPTSGHQYHYVAPRTHNGGAVLSVVCALLWPLSFLIPVLVNEIGRASCRERV